MVETKTGLPLPLGGNVLRKDLSPEVQRDLPKLFAKASITVWTIARPRCATPSLTRGTWTRELAGKFIGMYVNDYTRDYGETGESGDPGISSCGQRSVALCPLPSRAWNSSTRAMPYLTSWKEAKLRAFPSSRRGDPAGCVKSTTCSGFLFETRHEIRSSRTQTGRRS